MFFTKQLPLIVTSISLIGVLAGCGSSSTASAPANSQSNTISTSSKDATANSKASTTTAKSGAAAGDKSASKSTTASDAKTASTSKDAKPAKTQFPDTYNPSLVSVLKVDNSTLKKDLQSGKSLADVAKAQGVDEQKVIDTLVNNSKANLDKAVASGKMTKSDEEKALANLKTEMKQVVEHRTPTKG